MASRLPWKTVGVRNVPRGTWNQLQRQQGPMVAQSATEVARETIVDPPIVLTGTTDAVEVDVAKIVTVGVRISMVMDAIGMDETATTAIITAIIGIMAGIMMAAVETSGMTSGVITTFAMEMETVMVDMGDIPIK